MIEMKPAQNSPTSSEGQFCLTFGYRFEAAHRLSQALASQCNTPHGHTWHAEASFLSPTISLDDDDMVMEFAQLKGGWKSFIQTTVDHSYLHHHNDQLLPAMRDVIPDFRGLPFPGDPTTELIAALFFSKLSVMHDDLLNKIRASGKTPPTGLYANSVLIKETPTNSVLFCKGPASDFLLQKLNEKFEGWWQVADPQARHLQVRTL